MILGGAESTLWEITAAYAGMARSLMRYPARPLGKKYMPSDYHPNYYEPQLEEKKEEGTANGLMSASAIHQMLVAMQELNRPEERSGWDAYTSARTIAWKTGTSWEFKDAWAIGITATHVVGVWIGNADGEGRPELTGVKAAAPLMFDILEVLPQERSFPVPYTSFSLPVCRESGHKAGPYCEKSVQTTLPPIAEKAQTCPYHQLLHLNEEKNRQVNSSCYPVNQMVQKSWFVLPAAEAWYYKQYQSTYVEPPEFLASCPDKGVLEKQFMELIYPREYTRLYIPVELDGKPGSAVFEVAHRNPSAVVFWHLNEQYLGKTT